MAVPATHPRKPHQQQQQQQHFQQGLQVLLWRSWIPIRSSKAIQTTRMQQAAATGPRHLEQQQQRRVLPLQPLPVLLWPQLAALLQASWSASSGCSSSRRVPWQLVALPTAKAKRAGQQLQRQAVGVKLARLLWLPMQQQQRRGSSSLWTSCFLA
jgi:hypothetical protein